MTDGLHIRGIGAHIPDGKTTSQQLDQRLGLACGEVERQTGVPVRHYCVGDEDQISMATKAAHAALDAAGLRPTDIDLVISACAVPYQPIPSTAPAVQRALGIPDGQATAFDINSTCLSFLNALECCDGLLAAGRYQRALIVCSEVASRALPWQTRPDIAGLFGDGAAAVVVERGQGQGIIATGFETHPSGYDICGIGAGGTRFDFRDQAEDFAANTLFQMDGKELFRLSSKHFARFVDDLLARAGWTKDQVDLVVPHQASPLALAHMIRACGFQTDQVIDITRVYGNQIAASLPISLNHAVDHGRLSRGQRLLMLGTSAGVSFGGIAMVY
ncbi:3-oxoacyl-[acyl-carrier-protein] synthase III C-terminal domain-containing protein [Pseudaestuariivita rosea]|uniref:3-oxoacyl-[acyl-carrier-protein] synthase III C-terminal domain-containing protein n=1 Tax=Pseudaestuariivita rosea TaxID=2763263 RepID=UPI001ABBDB7C|nr:3-oxoacyl-[acyl-carrier-protein] synthase III C-terminal domain-containing protein [Pseudaestuariivita rosea]